MSESEPWTVGRLLSWTSGFLKDHGADTPRLDAEVLLAEALGCRRIELYTRFEEVAAEGTRTAFRELVRRRAGGEPVAYLVGRREFYSLSFRVTPAVLIPRPETEHLVVALLDLAREQAADAPLTIADVGTGSGIIAVCAAKNLPASRVAAIDVSPEALEVARLNAADHGVVERIEFVQSDLFAAVDPAATFDFVASNPPYLGAAEVAATARDVHRYEPRQALDAGPSGTAVIERLVPEALKRLRPGGHLIIEISPVIHDAARRILEAQQQLEVGETVKDLARLPRVLVGRKVEG